MSQFKISRVFTALTLLLLGPHIGAAQGSDMVSFHSAHGDQVDLVVGTRLSGGFPSRQVRICLENPKQNRTGKGLSNHRGITPDLVVASGTSACLDLAPVRQTLVLWSQNAMGEFDISMMTPLDLREKTGNIYFLRWSAETAQTR